MRTESHYTHREYLIPSLNMQEVNRKDRMYNLQKEDCKSKLVNTSDAHRSFNLSEVIAIQLLHVYTMQTGCQQIKVIGTSVDLSTEAFILV